MSEETELESQEVSEYVKPDPAKNPRNQVLAELAAAAARRQAEAASETFPTIDEDGNVTPPEAAPPEPQSEGNEPPATPPGGDSASPPPAAPMQAIDPEKTYKVKVDGQELEVSGKAIIDAGFRTFQKEAAADFRLQLASRLLQEAEAKVRAAATQAGAQQPQDKPPQAEMSDEDLAKAIQFGTPEQAAAALKELRARPTVTPEQVAAIVDSRARRVAQDEIEFQEARRFVETEYADLLSNDYLRRLFFLEENRRRAPKERGGEGDTRPYKDLYRSIGEDIRKAFNIQKPGAAKQQSLSPGTAQRAERKAQTPPVPRTAETRMRESGAEGRVPSPSEIIAKMAAARGHDRLTQQRKGA